MMKWSHGKGAMLSKMPGDYWQKFANLRALYGYMYAHPGKKLLFMGGEIGQWSEWNHDWQLDWPLLDHDFHRKMQAYVKALNKLYVEEPALHQVDFSWEGFQWIDFHDVDQGVVSFVRRAHDPATSSWRWPISRPCRARAIVSVCRCQGSIASSSIVTRPFTAAVIWETPAAGHPNLRPGRANSTRSRLRSRPSPWCSSSPTRRASDNVQTVVTACTLFK